MSELKKCPLCGAELKVYGPEDWKPTFYDPDSGGDPYTAVCDCGFNFHTNHYDYAEFVKAVNRRAQPENAEETKCRCPCGEQDDSFCPICTKIRVQAIKEKLDRENPKSLTPDELKQMYGEPVYLHILDTGLKVWAVVMEVSSGGGLLRFNCGQNALIISDYGKTWVAYRRKPERSEG